MVSQWAHPWDLLSQITFLTPVLAANISLVSVKSGFRMTLARSRTNQTFVDDTFSVVDYQAFRKVCDLPRQLAQCADLHDAGRKGWPAAVHGHARVMKEVVVFTMAIDRKPTFTVHKSGQRLSRRPKDCTYPFAYTACQEHLITSAPEVNRYCSVSLCPSKF